MTKNDLVEAVASVASKWTKKDVEGAVNAIFQTLSGALIQNEHVEIRGWGSFRVKERQGRMGRNPKTGDMVSIPPRRVPVFTVGKALKLRVDNSAVPLED